MFRLTKAVREKSRLSKEDWREYTKTVWSIANTKHDEHPAVFPAEIPHRLIRLFTWHGETVLDPFAGVGTTAEAAIRLGRRVVCVDQSDEYTDIIRRDCGRLRNGAYPEDGPPIAIFQELQVRSFAYMLLMPTEPGYAELKRLTNELPSVGKGFPRVVTRGDRVAAAWPNCPLVEKPPPTS